MKIIVDGEEFDIPYKRMRVDAFLEKVGLVPGKDRLILISSTQRKVTEFCCLHDVVEISQGMCFTSRRARE